MPVTFKVAPHGASVLPPDTKLDGAYTPEALLKSHINGGAPEVSELLQTSVSAEECEHLLRRHNGLVHGVIDAYNGHHHIELRPDDIWIAILTQFSIYVNHHAEELREQFVDHEGRKELVIVDVGTRYTVDFGKLAARMTVLMQENIKDPSLHSLIIPTFSTTTRSDVVIAAVTMMATLSQYFSYTFELRCGIPSITLHGTRADWEDIAARVEQLARFGTEPTAWVVLLRPVIARFVHAFDGPGDVSDDFWQRICSWKVGGSGPSFLGGWITAFCVWDDKGVWQGGAGDGTAPHGAHGTSRGGGTRGVGARPGVVLSRSGKPPPLSYAGNVYPVIDAKGIPAGVCAVDVILNDNGVIFPCAMIAGHVGVRASASGGQGGALDTLTPAAEWFMYIKKGPA